MPNLIRGYLQAHLRRTLMFVDGGHTEYKAGRPLMTALATRAIYENIANICDFSEKLKPLCDALDYKAMEAHVTKATFVTRLPELLDESDAKAPNILGQIDRMNKRFPEFRSAYDHLSEIVHPNGMGSLVYFAKLENSELTFLDTSSIPENAVRSLISACFLLLFVDYELKEIEGRLQKVNAALNRVTE